MHESPNKTRPERDDPLWQFGYSSAGDWLDSVEEHLERRLREIDSLYADAIADYHIKRAAIIEKLEEVRSDKAKLIK